MMMTVMRGKAGRQGAKEKLQDGSLVSAWCQATARRQAARRCLHTLQW